MELIATRSSKKMWKIDLSDYYTPTVYVGPLHTTLNGKSFVFYHGKKKDVFSLFLKNIIIQYLS